MRNVLKNWGCNAAYVLALAAWALSSSGHHRSGLVLAAVSVFVAIAAVAAEKEGG